MKKSTKKIGNNNKSVQKIKVFKFNFDIRTVFIIIFTSFFIYTLVGPALLDQAGATDEVSLTKIVEDISNKKVKTVLVEDNKISATYNSGVKLVTRKEEGDSFRQILSDAKIPLGAVNIEAKDSTLTMEILRIAGSIIPAILLFGFFWFMIRQARGSQDSVFSFGQSRAKRFTKLKSNITFKDVAGVEEAKKELEEIVDFLKHPAKYIKLGARSPKGVMLVGPAGTGKTLLAKAVAGEANVPFFSIAGSEFMEMLVGIGASRVRDLFKNAKKSSPAIIFIDEIDAIGRARSRGGMPAHDEREQTLNQILVEMDGFTPNEQVIVIAATNRGDLLDPALLRPGRFDRRVIVDYPDIEGREAIIKIHSIGKPLDKSVQLERIARRTVGYSGADIENMMNEAAISAARNNRSSLTMEDIEEAATKVKLGPEKKRLQTDHDREITAYHEAGHAIVSHFQKHTDPVHRISIVSRGMALGYTLIPPGRDKLHTSKTQLMERISVMMGGRAAEELIFNDITSGASNDFDQATYIARKMVTDFGMSKLGPINFGPTQDITDFSASYFDQNTISQEMMSQIDSEINRILREAYADAVKIVNANKISLNKVAKELVDREIMDQDQFEKIVGKKDEREIKSKAYRSKKI